MKKMTYIMYCVFLLCIFSTSLVNAQIISDVLPDDGYGLAFTPYFDAITLTIFLNSNYKNPQITWTYAKAKGFDSTVVAQETLQHIVKKEDLQDGRLVVSVLVEADNPEYPDNPNQKVYSEYSWDIYSDEDYNGPGEYIFNRRNNWDRDSISGYGIWQKPDDVWSVLNDSIIAQIAQVDYGRLDFYWHLAYTSWEKPSLLKITKLRFDPESIFHENRYFQLFNYKVEDIYYINRENTNIGPIDPYTAYLIQDTPTLWTTNANGELVRISPTESIVIHGAYPHYTINWDVAHDSLPEGGTICTLPGKSMTFMTELGENPDIIYWYVNQELLQTNEQWITLSADTDTKRITFYAFKAKPYLNLWYDRYEYKREWEFNQTSFRVVPTLDYSACTVPYPLDDEVVLNIKPWYVDVVITQTDLFLPGRGGLDLRLTRILSSSWWYTWCFAGPTDGAWSSILNSIMDEWFFDFPYITPYYIYCDGKIYPNCLETERREWGWDKNCFPWAQKCEKIGKIYYYREGRFRFAEDGYGNVVLTKEDGTSYVFPCTKNADGWSYGPLKTIIDKTGINQIHFSYNEDSATIIDSVGRQIIVSQDGITVNGIKVVSYSIQEIEPPEEPPASSMVINELSEETQSSSSYTFVYTITDAVGRTKQVVKGDGYFDIISSDGNIIHLVTGSGLWDHGIISGSINGREISIIHDEEYKFVTIKDGSAETTVNFELEEGYYRPATISDGHRTYHYTYERRQGADPGCSPANNWYYLLSSVEVTQGGSSYTRTFTYDEDCRLISTTGPDGTINYTYHVIDEPDRYFVGVATQTHGPLSTTYSYNDLGQVVSVRSGSAPATRYEYDEYGNVKKIVDPKGNGTEIVYDEAYHALPAVVGTRGPDGGWERYEANEYYYPFGWLKKRTVGPYETTYTYDAVGRVLSVTDRTGTTTTTYDDAELWTETTDPEGNRTRTTFDRLGRTIRVESFTAGGVSLGTTEYVYDPQHDERLWKILQNGRLMQEIVVDEDANTRTTRDADGNTSIEYYDLAGRLVKTESYLAVAEGEEPAVRTTTYAYDPETGALASVTDPARITTYRYNDRGLVDLVAYSDGKTEETLYDENGNPVRVKDRGGRWTDYEYNRYNEVTSVKIGQETVATYAYDNLGRVIAAGAGDVQYTYIYDDLGRLARSTRAIEGRVYELHYEYDDYDRVTGLTVKDAAGRVLARFGYAYTPETVRVSAEVKGEMKEFAAATIGEGGVTAGKTLGNGLAQNFGYDARLRLAESTLAGAAGVVQAHAYEYGLAGNITRIDAQSFGYDRLGHLTAATGGLEDIAYEYDPLGNRLREIRGGTVTEYVYQDGLLMQAGATSYTYHPDGSLATKTKPGEAWEYAYDIQGRLTTVTLNGATVGTYGYDQDGLRVWKEENGRTTIYIRDGLEVLYEEDFTGPVTPEATPVETRARVFLGGEIAGLVVNGTEAHYYVNDHLGTTELVTDERGRLAENISHTPFSERIKVLAYSYLEQRLTETDWLDLTNTTARIEDGRAGPAKVPVEVEEFLHQDETRVLVEDPHYTPAKEYIYRHDDPDVLELKVTSGFKDPETGGYVEYVDYIDLSGKALGDYKVLLETRKDVGQVAPTENLKFEVYVSKRLQPVESVLRTKPIFLGDAIAFSFTPQGTGLEDIVWSISRDNGQTWVEVQTGTLLPADGASEILLKADLKVVEGHEQPSVTGIDWVFVAERETSERYTFTGKERDATGLYYFGARYYNPELGQFITEDPTHDGLNWYEYCNNNPLTYTDLDGYKKIKNTCLTGLIAHKIIEIMFVYSGPYGTKRTEVRHPLGKADLVYLNGRVLQVGEIKPDTWLEDPMLNILGKAQLAKEMAGISQLYSQIAKPLIAWKPNFQFKVPGTEWTLVVYTVESDPGMIYYYFDDGKPDGTPQPGWVEYLSFYKSFLLWLTKCKFNSLIDVINNIKEGINSSYRPGLYPQSPYPVPFLPVIPPIPVLVP